MNANDKSLVNHNASFIRGDICLISFGLAKFLDWGSLDSTGETIEYEWSDYSKVLRG